MERKLDFDLWGLLLLCALLLLLPLNWVTAAFSAAIFHELCHLAAVKLCGGKLVSVYAGASGIIMQTSPMENYQEAICAAAGPIGSFLLLLFIRRIPYISICALFQGLFNLLPIYPLDGGRILKSFASDTVCRIVKYIVIVFLLLIAIASYALVRIGIFPFWAVLFLFFRAMEIKIPCKQVRKRVQ